MMLLRRREMPHRFGEPSLSTTGTTSHCRGFFTLCCWSKLHNKPNQQTKQPSTVLANLLYLGSVETSLSWICAAAAATANPNLHSRTLSPRAAMCSVRCGAISACWLARVTWGPAPDEGAKKSIHVKISTKYNIIWFVHFYNCSRYDLSLTNA